MLFIWFLWSEEEIIWYIYFQKQFQLWLFGHIWWRLDCISHAWKILWLYLTTKSCLFNQQGLYLFSFWCFCHSKWIPAWIQPTSVITSVCVNQCRIHNMELTESKPYFWWTNSAQQFSNFLPKICLQVSTVCSRFSFSSVQIPTYISSITKWLK